MQDPRPEIRNLVARHPWMSVATATAIGAGLAVVLHPRSLLGRATLVIAREVIRGVIFDKLEGALLTRVSRPMPSPVVNGSTPPPS